MGLGEEERFDLVDEDCRLVGSTKPRSEVHRDGDWHQAVHVWVLFHDTWRVVMQRRCKHKDSWPLMWDISAAGHVTAGGVPLETAKRELAEELGLEFPDNAFRYLFRNKQEFRGEFHGKAFVNNEFNHVFAVTLRQELPRHAYRLQAEEVDDVKHIALSELGALLREGDEKHVTYLAGLGRQGGALENAKYTELFRLEREEVEDSRWVEAQVNGCRAYYLDCGDAGLCSGD